MIIKRMNAMLLTLVLLCAGLGMAETGDEQEAETMRLWIGETAVQVVWEDNDAVRSLRELVAEQPLTIEMSMYGGFEQTYPGTMFRRPPGRATSCCTPGIRWWSSTAPIPGPIRGWAG